MAEFDSEQADDIEADLDESKDFEGSKNKSVVRQMWDRPILQTIASQVGRPLAYFGLPGPAVQDLIEWADLLGVKTGVERLRRGAKRQVDLERHRRLYRNVAINGLSA